MLLSTFFWSVIEYHKLYPESNSLVKSWPKVHLGLARGGYFSPKETLG